MNGNEETAYPVRADSLTRLANSNFSNCDMEPAISYQEKHPSGPETDQRPHEGDCM